MTIPRRAALPILVLALLGLLPHRLAAEPPAPKPQVAADHAAQMTAGLKLFREHVRSILIDNCVHCHGDGETESGFDLTTREKLLAGGDYGEPGVIPGDAEHSWLLRLVRHDEEPVMPLEASKLEPEEIAHLAAWINSGAPYDKPLVEEVDDTPWTERVVPEEAKEYWAFQPLQKVTPPAGEPNDWVRTPVDRFVWAKLQEQGIAPNPRAEKRTLLRRAYFDLIGMPPSVEEARAFLKDTSPDAYEKLIERLLDSPHFGERWARHWLDVARFAESHGFEQDYDRPHAYHYRDFVIQAFNRDMPYDQFVRWQLAGDELAPDEPLALKATGFLGAGVYPTQITLREVEPSRYDALDDMANTTGQAFLGMTIGCARCHDHKFDPIPQADYYRFASIFTTTVRSNIDVVISPVTPEQKQQYERKTEQLAAQLAAFERDQLPGRLDRWMHEQADHATVQDGWQILTCGAESAAGATFAALDDGSLLVSGANADSDEYHFTADTDLAAITALRVEALAHPSLTRGGPGRADNGNFCLSRIYVTASPKNDPTQKQEVTLVAPRATYQQNDGHLAIEASLDDNLRSGWAVDFGGIGKSHAAEFRFAQPIGFAGGTRLHIRMVFAGNTRHQLGRPRLSITSAAEPLALMSDEPAQPPAELLSDIDFRAGVAALAPQRRAALLKWYRATDPDWQKLSKALEAHKKNPPKPVTEKVMVASEGYTPIRHHMPAGAPDFYEKCYFLKRGDTSQKVGEATPGFLQVLMRTPEKEAHWQIEPPAGARTSFRRAALAGWITDTQYGAGHLLARVIVNRLWHLHFGQGIVPTPNDFGMQSEAPSHPELLDYLAQELIRNGWRLKPIHKLIMTSGVYMQSSQFRQASFEKDNRNRLLWRFEPRRIEAEAIRDSLLAVTGSLDERMFGPGTLDESMRRRSIYFTVKRSKLIPMLTLFDAPEAVVTQGDRGRTTIGPQALWFLNNPQVRSWARNFAERIEPAYQESPEAAVRQAYWIAVCREPHEHELELAVAFLAQQSSSYEQAGKANAARLALADFCQGVVSLNEFIYMD